MVPKLIIPEESLAIQRMDYCTTQGRPIGGGFASVALTAALFRPDSIFRITITSENHPSKSEFQISIKNDSSNAVLIACFENME